MQPVLTNLWQPGDNRIAALIGEATHTHELISQWVASLKRNTERPLAGMFHWDFRESSVLSFQGRLLEYLQPMLMTQKPILAEDVMPQLLQESLYQSNILIVLTTVNWRQDFDGKIADPELLAWLTWFATAQIEARCVIASRESLVDLLPYEGFNQTILNPHIGTDAIEFLTQILDDTQPDPSEVGWVNVYPQHGPHDPASLVVNRFAAEQLIQALQSKIDGQVKSFDVFNSDGEQYTLSIQVSDDLGQWQQLRSSYTDPDFHS